VKRKATREKRRRSGGVALKPELCPVRSSQSSPFNFYSIIVAFYLNCNLKGIVQFFNQILRNQQDFPMVIFIIISIPNHQDLLFFQAMAEEDELTLPRASINKIIKEIIPNIRVAQDSRELILNCCTEFIHLISSEANEICNQNQKKTINAEHVLTGVYTYYNINPI